MSTQQRVSFFRGHLTWAVTAFVGYTSVMLTLERQMQRCGGPGIIAFELAGNAERAQRIMTAWGDGGRRCGASFSSARFRLYGYLWRVDRIAGGLRPTPAGPPGRGLPWCVPAVAADALEGVAS